MTSPPSARRGRRGAISPRWGQPDAVLAGGHAVAERLAEGSAEGSVALSLCTTAHPLHTRVANIFGASYLKR
jgi:hypothetical protein